MEILDCVAITPELTDSFAALIPPSLLQALREEKILGLGSLLGDVPNGALIFQLEAHGARILSLYVDCYDRRNGTGRFLMEKLREVLRDVPGLCSLRAVLPDGDAGAVAFFEALGARLETVESGVRFPLSALENSPLLHAPESPRCISGTALGREERSHYQRTLEKNGEYLMEKDLNDPAVLQELSRYYVKDKQVLACAVMTEAAKGVCLAMLINQGDTTVLPVLLGSLARGLWDACLPETEISLETVTPETQTLLQRIVPGAVRNSRMTAVLSV